MEKQSRLEFTVNGQVVSVDVDPGEMLANVLREKLGLTGTKIGCNEAECGACTVLLDGRPILSCTYPAQRAHGHEVLTIEGLAVLEAGEKKLHPLQQAFVDYGAVQCGFCSPGQIMTAYALLQENPTPTSEDVRRELKDTLCRCAAYPTIENAIQAAAKSVRTGQPVEPPDILVSSHPRKSVGRLFPRPEATEKVTGEALFTDDIKFEGMLYARVKRAEIPHGILTRLDVEKARNFSRSSRGSYRRRYPRQEYPRIGNPGLAGFGGIRRKNTVRWRCSCNCGCRYGRYCRTGVKVN